MPVVLRLPVQAHSSNPHAPASVPLVVIAEKSLHQTKSGTLAAAFRSIQINPMPTADSWKNALNQLFNFYQAAE